MHSRPKSAGLDRAKPERITDDDLDSHASFNSGPVVAKPTVRIAWGANEKVRCATTIGSGKWWW